MEDTNLREQVQDQELLVVQMLEGALMYAPELPELHRQLIEVEFNGYFAALRRGDLSIQRKISRKLLTHLEMLPQEEQEYWRTRLERDLDLIKQHHRNTGSFVGRVDVVERCLELFTYHSTICLLGTAGVGKTRLALEVASRLQQSELCSVLFCDASSARDELALIQLLGTTLISSSTQALHWRAL